MSRPRDTNIIHIKFVLKCRRNAVENTKSYKARLVVCGNGEMKHDEDKLFPMPFFTVIKLVMCLDEQSWYHRRHFKNTFPNEKLQRKIYAELPKDIYADQMRAKNVMRVKPSLYGLKYAARIWYELLIAQFFDALLTQLEISYCVFTCQNTI